MFVIENVEEKEIKKFIRKYKEYLSGKNMKSKVYLTTENIPCFFEGKYKLSTRSNNSRAYYPCRNNA